MALTKKLLNSEAEKLEITLKLAKQKLLAAQGVASAKETSSLQSAIALMNQNSERSASKAAKDVNSSDLLGNLDVQIDGLK